MRFEPHEAVMWGGLALLALYIYGRIGARFAYDVTRSDAPDARKAIGRTQKECVDDGADPGCCLLGAQGNFVSNETFHNCKLCNHPDCTGFGEDTTFHPII